MSDRNPRYDSQIEWDLERIDALLTADYPLTRRAIGLLLLAGDEEIAGLVRDREGAGAAAIAELAEEAQRGQAEPISLRLARHRQEAAERILAGLVRDPGRPPAGWAERLSQAMIRPSTGLPILAVALATLYLVVGVLGAQTLVDALDRGLFGSWLNPWLVELAGRWLPWDSIRQLLVGPFGMFTLGLRYAVAIILPIVGTFFLAFAVIEDSGYLPRLALLIDRTFKRLGLNGRAVIPMVLGFGCDTMATIVTRTLETRRERVIATLLLALAIPCSAQLGVILALLTAFPAGLAIWAAVISAVFVAVGFLAARVMPGERPAFFMELPPLRLPRAGNVLVKTYTRVEWYLREVVPVFVLVSVLIWLGQVTGVFPWVIARLEPVVEALGLPAETAVAFLFGFFRRDYGAAGLLDLQEAMTGAQRTVAAVTLTLFLPCVAQFSVMIKERGWKTALAATGLILPLSFGSGWAVSRVFELLGVT